ncbi:hypothetical protein [Chondrinema litorale]|uniref:hypothetical protein n=1 Tax=Chondrinema litorale TaxID=2994555 RepID=UPI002542B0D3|nr:hypothetical protein [Chondrinema litorale]UZR97227.1 hypothetical protein OQ292_25340 [Chondrinema litorale]
MKLILSIFFSFFLTITAFSQSSFDGIEDKIYQAFGQCFMQSDDDPLMQVISELETAVESEENPWAKYWLANAKIDLSLYYMKSSESDNEAASQTMDEAINILEEIKDKNTEEYALLARALGINISINPSKAMNLSAKVNTNIKKSLKLNDNNLRAYLQSGSSDFYTPEEYGGGKIAESQFLKALSLPDKTIDEAAAPTWGRDEVYYMLVSFYLREENYDQAKIFLNKGLKEFPENQRLASLSSKI